MTAPVKSAEDLRAQCEGLWLAESVAHELNKIQHYKWRAEFNYHTEDTIRCALWAVLRNMVSDKCYVSAEAIYFNGDQSSGLADIIVWTEDGLGVPFEVKRNESELKPKDSANLRRFIKKHNDSPDFGVIIYGGDETKVERDGKLLVIQMKLRPFK